MCRKMNALLLRIVSQEMNLFRKTINFRFYCRKYFDQIVTKRIQSVVWIVVRRRMTEIHANQSKRTCKSNALFLETQILCLQYNEVTDFTSWAQSLLQLAYLSYKRTDTIS